MFFLYFSTVPHVLVNYINEYIKMYICIYTYIHINEYMCEPVYESYNSTEIYRPVCQHNLLHLLKCQI